MLPNGVANFSYRTPILLKKKLFDHSYFEIGIPKNKILLAKVRYLVEKFRTNIEV